MKKIKLICFPYAGGVSQFYVNIFFNNLSPNLELIPIEYSGHGSRYTEELFTSIDEFINDVILEIKKMFIILMIIFYWVIAWEVK